MVNSGAHTVAIASRKLNEPCKDNPISVEEEIQLGPSNTEILNNQVLFQTHLEEIDCDFETLPNVTGVASIGTMHGNDVLYTDTNGSQVEENTTTKTTGRIQT